MRSVGMMGMQTKLINEVRGLQKKNVLKSVVLIVLMLVIVVGCSSANTNDSQPDAPAASNTGKETVQPDEKPQEVALSMWSRWPGPMEDMMKETITEFEQAYPHIKVELASAAPDQYVAQLQTAIAGENLPDIFAAHPTVPVYQLHELDQLLPLSDVIGDRIHEFEQGSLVEGTTQMNGEVYALPIMSSKKDGFVMYYNMDVLEKAGLTEADVPKTWEELIKVSEQVVAATNRESYGLLYGLKSSWLVGLVAQTMGSEISPEVLPFTHMNPTNGHYELNRPGIVETLEFFKDMVDAKLVHPNSLVITAQEASSLFVSGQAAFLFDGAWRAAEFVGMDFVDFGVEFLPTKSGGQQYIEFTGNLAAGLHASKHTKHPEEVGVFLRYFMDKYYPKIVNAGVQYSPMPTINEAATMPHELLKKTLQIQNEQFVPSPDAIMVNQNAVAVYSEASGKKPKETIGTIMEGYLSGQISDLAGTLQKLSDETQKAHEDAIAKVKQEGLEVDVSDWVFPNWTPLVPYEAQ
ncbi:sugar ABC transporter substrate-binding protein [Paenibacillus sp. J5C_2022]|nr:sugar ABC transporter substrate-binding protein [Paenibacillus sp. J5C2022]